MRIKIPTKEECENIFKALQAEGSFQEYCLEVQYTPLLTVWDIRKWFESRYGPNPTEQNLPSTGYPRDKVLKYAELFSLSVSIFGTNFIKVLARLGNNRYKNLVQSLQDFYLKFNKFTDKRGEIKEVGIGKLAGAFPEFELKGALIVKESRSLYFLWRLIGYHLLDCPVQTIGGVVLHKGREEFIEANIKFLEIIKYNIDNESKQRSLLGIIYDDAERKLKPSGQGSS